MAPRLPKRVLQPSDLKDTQRLLEVLNPLLESYSALLAGGLSLDNVRQITVTAKVKPPDEWTPLALVAPFARYPNAAFPVPGYKSYADGGAARVRVRGLLAHGGLPAPAPGTSIATGLPLPRWQSRHTVDGADAHALVETLTDGRLTYSSGNVSLLSLEGVDYETAAALPPWPAAVDVTLQGPNGEDYGTPALVVVLGATRTDRVTCMPDFIPMWETPVTGEGGKRERKLRIRRLGGLAAGVEHLVTFMCLYR